MNVRTGFRGRPLIALVVVLGGWIGLRALFWDAGAVSPAVPGEPHALARVEAQADGPVSIPEFLMEAGLLDSAPDQDEAAAGGASAAAVAEYAVPARSLPPMPVGYRAAMRRHAAAGLLPAGYQPYPVYPAYPYGAYMPAAYVAPAWRPANVPVRVAVGHQMLRAAMLTQMPMALRMGPAMTLTAGASAGDAAAPFYPPLHDMAQQHRRWSADAWLLRRGGGGGTLAGGLAPATYGASQAGAVLRYRLAPDSGHRPAAYLRTTATLNGSGEKEAALGLSARPFANLPVIAAAELRATAQPGGTRLRPAAMVVSEVPPFALPRKLRGEAYAQAGYVGGRHATAFVDGQLRVDRQVASIGRAELRAGAGAWGGAQQGASRLDVGPAATMAMALGGSASARLAVDWRFRVAGNAEPDSGPALTLSAGF